MRYKFFMCIKNPLLLIYDLTYLLDIDINSIIFSFLIKEGGDSLICLVESILSGERMSMILFLGKESFLKNGIDLHMLINP
jgi:hypothetical protein